MNERQWVGAVVLATALILSSINFNNVPSSDWHLLEAVGVILITIGSSEAAIKNEIRKLKDEVPTDQGKSYRSY